MTWTLYELSVGALVAVLRYSFKKHDLYQVDPAHLMDDLEVNLAEVELQNHAMLT
jgi:hypothetical protein